MRQLGLRAIVNLVTGAGVTVLLLVLRVDFPLMWGILAFFLSFIPWIGLPLAVAPAVVLALAEYGLDQGVAGHRGGDSDQHTGRERALADADGPWA